MPTARHPHPKAGQGAGLTKCASLPGRRVSGMTQSNLGRGTEPCHLGPSHRSAHTRGAGPRGLPRATCEGGAELEPSPLVVPPRPPLSAGGCLPAEGAGEGVGGVRTGESGGGRGGDPGPQRASEPAPRPGRQAGASLHRRPGWRPGGRALPSPSGGGGAPGWPHSLHLVTEASPECGPFMSKDGDPFPVPAAGARAGRRDGQPHRLGSNCRTHTSEQLLPPEGTPARGSPMWPPVPCAGPGWERPEVGIKPQHLMKC